MKRVDSETLQFVNKTNTSNFKSDNSKEKLIELNSSGDTEFIDFLDDKISDNSDHNKMKTESNFITNTTNTKNIISNDVEELELDPVNFVDDFYDAMGSNKLSKETGMKAISSLGIGLSNFIEEKDIKTVEKRGSGGKNVLVTLKDGSSYFIVNEDGKPYLSYITDRNGKEISFGRNFEDFLNKFRKRNQAGDPVTYIKDISLLGGDIIFYMDGSYNTEKYRFDMETKKLREISTKFMTYYPEDIIKEVSERLANYLNDGSTAEDIINKYNLNLDIDNIKWIQIDGTENYTKIKFCIGDMNLRVYDDGTSKRYTIFSNIDGVELPEDENLTL